MNGEKFKNCICEGLKAGQFKTESLRNLHHGWEKKLKIACAKALKWYSLEENHNLHHGWRKCRKLHTRFFL